MEGSIVEQSVIIRTPTAPRRESDVPQVIDLERSRLFVPQCK